MLDHRMSNDPRKVVLIVDDEPDVRDAIAGVLDDQGYATVTARHGAEALSLLRAGEVRPDVILLDIMMPEMDGWQFRSLQCQDERLCAIPVVVLSANELARAAAFDMGVAAFLKKPVKLDALLATLRKHSA